MDCVGLAGLCDQRNRHPKGFPVRTLMTSGVDRMWFLGKRADVFMRGRDRAISQVNVAIQRLEEKLSDAEEVTSGRLLRTYEGRAVQLPNGEKRELLSCECRSVSCLV